MPYHKENHYKSTMAQMLAMYPCGIMSFQYIQTRMLISIVSRPCMNDIIIIDHVLFIFTHQFSDTKLWSKYCELK